MQIEDISSLNEREQCDEYTDGVKKATSEDVEVNMKLFNEMKIKKKKLSLCSWCFHFFL